MESYILDTFLAIVGAMIIPIIPIQYLSVFDTIVGRFVLFGIPVIVYHYTGLVSSIMCAVVSGILLDRIHDVMPNKTKKTLDKETVLVDLSPDFTKHYSDEIVMLESPSKRMGI